MVDEPGAAAMLADALDALATAAGSGVDDLLAAFPDVGDVSTQRAVDDTVDAAADLLRAVSAEARDICARVRSTVGAGATPHRVASR